MGDLAGILDLYKQLDAGNDRYEEGAATAAWKEILGDESIRYYVAVDEGKIIGTCFIVIVTNLTKGVRPFAIIENVITDEDHRGKGIGKTLIGMAVERAKARNCYKVQLMSNVKRKDAHLFYERIGFDGNSKRGFEIRFM